MARSRRSRNNKQPQDSARHTTAENGTFSQIGVPDVLVQELARQGIATPFPIQVKTLPDSLNGRDVLGRGRTGSGKTLAFALPLLARLAASAPARRQPKRPRALILAPTRELAAQINAVLAPLAKNVGLETTTVFGGVAAGPQIAKLKRGVDVVVACPGRLADHLNTGAVMLDAIEITVLDEADHMADLGFLPTVKRLLDKTPARGQRMLFSATLDNGVNEIVRRYLHDPVTHSVDDEQVPNETLEHHVLHVAESDRLAVLAELLSGQGRVVVFTRTKHRAKQLTKKLVSAGVSAVEMHGNLSQGARTRNLEAFSSGKASALVATDIAARGIHVDDVTLVVHADPPVEHKAYVHRSGRTARAGNDGKVITLMTDDQRQEVKTLTRKAGVSPTVTAASPGAAVIGTLVPDLGTNTLRPIVSQGVPASAPASRQPASRQPAGQRSASSAGTESRPGPAKRNRNRNRRRRSAGGFAAR